MSDDRPRISKAPSNVHRLQGRLRRAGGTVLGDVVAQAKLSVRAMAMAFEDNSVV